MTRMKKYVTAAAVAAALVGVPTMAHAIAPAGTPASTAGVQATTVAKASSSSSAQVVVPGKRIAAAPKVQLWLTKEGKHWSTPTMAGQFRSVTDGNLDMSQPGVSLQAEPVEGRYFLSGIYHGKGDAATVEIETAKGTVIGTVVRLAAETGWGAWYATSPLPDQTMVKDRRKQGFVRSVTVHDTAGQIIAQVTLPGFS